MAGAIGPCRILNCCLEFNVNVIGQPCFKTGRRIWGVPVCPAASGIKGDSQLILAVTQIFGVYCTQTAGIKHRHFTKLQILDHVLGQVYPAFSGTGRKPPNSKPT